MNLFPSYFLVVRGGTSTKSHFAFKYYPTSICVVTRPYKQITVIRVPPFVGHLLLFKELYLFSSCFHVKLCEVLKENLDLSSKSVFVPLHYMLSGKGNGGTVRTDSVVVDFVAKINSN